MLLAVAAEKSLDDSSVVIAFIAGFLEQFDPALGIVVELGRQNPAFKNFFLFGSMKAVDLDECTPSGEPLNFLQHLDGSETRKVVYSIETKHAIEAVIGKRKRF